MLKVFRKKTSILDEPIERIQLRMQAIEMHSEEYLMLLEELERLVRLRNEEKRNRVSPDTIAIGAANLLGILIIVGYEHGHVVGSRALNFVNPMRTKQQ